MNKKLRTKQCQYNFVIEDDKQYSPARIAGLSFDRHSDADSVEQNFLEMWLAFSETALNLNTSQRCSLGYVVGRRW